MGSAKKTTEKKQRKQTALPGTQSPTAPQLVVEVELDDIRQDPNQPRHIFHVGSIVETLQVQEDGSAVPEHGIREPIWLRHTLPGEVNADLDGRILHGKPPKYTIIEGERRFRAANQVGLKTIPAIIAQKERVFDDAHILALQLGASVGKSPLLPLELADGLARLVSLTPAHDEDAIGKLTGLGVRKMRRYLRLARLSPMVRKALEAERISESVAAEIATLDSHNDQEQAYRAAPGDVTVTQMRSLIASKFHLQLVQDKCGFDPDDKNLSPRACSACPKNTSVQRSLWADEAIETPTCTDKTCYVSKQQQSRPNGEPALEPAQKPGTRTTKKSKNAQVQSVVQNGAMHIEAPANHEEDDDATRPDEDRADTTHDTTLTRVQVRDALWDWTNSAETCEKLRVLVMLMSRWFDMSGKPWAATPKHVERYVASIESEDTLAVICVDVLLAHVSRQEMQSVAKSLGIECG